MYQIRDCCVTYCGLILRLIYKVGPKMIEEFHLSLDKMLSKSLSKSIGLTSFVEHIK